MNNNDLFSFLSFLAQVPFFKPLLRTYITMWLKGALRQEGFDYKRVKRLQNHIWYIEAHPNDSMLQQVLLMLDFNQYDNDLALYEKRIMEYNEALANSIHQALLRSGLYFIAEVRPFFRWNKTRASSESVFRFSIGIGAPIEYTPQASTGTSLSHQFQAEDGYQEEAYDDIEFYDDDEVFEQENVYA